MQLIRYTVFAISLAAVVVGVLVIMGELVPRNFPEEYRVIMGIVIVLYGVYRFLIAYFQGSGGRG